MKKLLTLFILLCMIGAVIAQTNVKIIDIAVSPVLEIDTATGQPNSNGEIINVLFKVKNIDQSDKVHILFGTAQDIGDVLTVQADVIENSGVFYLSYNGNQKAVNGYTAQTEVELTSQQAANYNYITLYIEDLQGQETSRLYFTK